MGLTYLIKLLRFLEYIICCFHTKSPFILYRQIVKFQHTASVQHIGILKILHFRKKFKLMPNSTSSCKISWRSDDWRPRYLVFSIFDIAAVRHLAFLNFRNFCQKFKLRPNSMYTCKIRSRSDESRPSYCTILISKITAVRHLGDFKICSFREKFHLMPNSRDLKNYGTATPYAVNAK